MSIAGQILPESMFGRLLTELARKASVIVEIGTWHGGGSTKCLAAGLIRAEQRFYTIEAHEPLYKEAQSHYSDPRITFLYGTVTPMNDIPVILDQLPAKIDLLLIDGGEDHGWADFQALQERSHVIALDDTSDACRKGKQARQAMLKAGWKVIADNLQDRNGWAVFQRA